MRNARAPMVPVITSIAEANAVLGEIGRTTRTIESIEQTLEAAILELRERANKDIAPLALALKQKTTQLTLFAESNRTSLVGEKKKSIVLPAGEFGWRYAPPKVTFGKGGAKKVLELLQSLRLKNYIRTTYEVDREALLRDRPSVKGVKYSQDELFYINPNAEDVSDVYPGTKAQGIM